MIRKRFSRSEIIISLFLLSIICGGTVVWGQSTETLFELYYKGDMQNLRQELDKLPDGEAVEDEIEFYRAVFIKDGDQAFPVYLQLYEKGQGRVKVLAAERLFQYYYAKGYYETATKYQKYVAENEGQLVKAVEVRPAEAPIDKPKKPVRDEVAPVHQIQVGAFSNEDNARELVRMLKTQNIASKIVKRKIGDAELYCVWIPGKASFEESLEYANTIKIKYDLNFRIIKE